MTNIFEDLLQNAKDAEFQNKKQTIFLKTEQEIKRLKKENNFTNEDLNTCYEIFKECFNKDASKDEINGYFNIRNLILESKNSFDSKQEENLKIHMKKVMDENSEMINMQNCDEAVSDNDKRQTMQWIMNLSENEKWSSFVDNNRLKRILDKSQNRFIEIDNEPESDELDKIDKWLRKIEMLGIRARYTMLGESMQTGAKMPETEEIKNLKEKYINCDNDTTKNNTKKKIEKSVTGFESGTRIHGNKIPGKPSADFQEFETIDENSPLCEPIYMEEYLDENHKEISELDKINRSTYYENKLYV